MRAAQSTSGIENHEISIMKAMLVRGKEAGFTAQKILSYFSRSERTINVARLYEIRDGQRGADVPTASDTQFNEFLARYACENSDPRRDIAPPWMPPPTYFGILADQVALVERDILVDTPSVVLRERLLSEQRRLVGWFTERWGRFQVDRRSIEHAAAYEDAASAPHDKVNIFTLDDEFQALRACIGNEPEALGESGEAQWYNFLRNHAVLTNLYPEMAEYRAALATTSQDVTLDEQAALEAVNALDHNDLRPYIRKEVQETIRTQIYKKEATHKPRERAYDVTSLLTTAFSKTLALFEILARTWHQRWRF